VTISVTCSDGVTLGQGSTQYKCRECGGSLNAHSKECAMRTSVSENNLDLSELDEKEREANSKIALLEAQISQLETENRNLLTQIANASVEEAPALRQQHNVNKTKIDNLKKELATWQQQLADIQNAKSEAANDNATSTDDYLPHPCHHAGCEVSLQSHVARCRFVERLHLRPNCHHAQHQRHYHLQGDTVHCKEAQVLPWHQDTPCDTANIVGADLGIHRHTGGGCADP